MKTLGMFVMVFLACCFVLLVAMVYPALVIPLLVSLVVVVGWKILTA